MSRSERASAPSRKNQYKPGTVVDVVDELYRAHAAKQRNQRYHQINQNRMNLLASELQDVALPMDVEDW